MQNYRVSVAPMMSYTDRHFRFLVRQLTSRVRLYTEMVVAETIIRRRHDPYLQRLLSFDPIEHPIAVQLGGDHPQKLAVAARICEDMGYDEINLNVGCPSDRVQRGRFGACLMKSADLVAEIAQAIADETNLPVTIKHRTGVDDHDDEAFLHHFVETVAQSPVTVFMVHARKAWLKGLSPAQNRSVPPLDYERVYTLKRRFPHLTIIVNGGITSGDEAVQHLSHVDGVMIGRAAYNDPTMLVDVANRCGGHNDPIPDPKDLLVLFNDYLEHQTQQGVRASNIIKHLINLFRGYPGARFWRRDLSLAMQSGELPDLRGVYLRTIASQPRPTDPMLAS